MQDRKRPKRDFRRIFAVIAGLSSINLLKPDDVLGEADPKYFNLREHSS